MFFRYAHFLSGFILVALLVLGQAHAINVTQVATPAQPIAANEAARVDFDFEIAARGDIRRHNAIFVIQVPDNWVVVASYLGPTDEKGELIKPLRSMTHLATPTNLHAQTDLAVPMQLIMLDGDFYDFLPPSYDHFNESFIERGKLRVLFIPGLSYDADGVANGIQTFAQHVKAAYGYLDADSQFQPTHPATIEHGDFANVPLLMQSFEGQPHTSGEVFLSIKESASTDLQFSGEVLQDTGVLPAMEELLHNTYRQVKLTLPADSNLRNRYGWRIFLSLDKQFGGTPLPTAGIRLESAAGYDSAWIRPQHERDNHFDTSQDYYVDIPVFPGHTLDVTIGQPVWPYVKAAPLTAQTEPPVSLDASLEDLPQVPNTMLISGEILLPEGHLAPEGGITFGLYPPYSYSRAPGFIWPEEPVYVTVPAGQNSIKYEIALPTVRSLSLSCIKNCENLFQGRYYHPKQLKNREEQGVDFFLEASKQVSVTGKIILGDNRIAPSGGIGVTVELQGTSPEHRVSETKYIVIPEGENALNYRIESFAPRSVDFRVQVQARCYDDCSSVSNDRHYYNLNGAVEDADDATLLQGVGSHENIDVVLAALFPVKISGEVFLPDAYITPSGGVELSVRAIEQDALRFSYHRYSPPITSGRIQIPEGTSGSFNYQLAPSFRADRNIALRILCIRNCDGLSPYIYYYHPDGSVLSPGDAFTLSSSHDHDAINFNIPAIEPLSTGNVISEGLGIQAFYTRDGINAIWRQGRETINEQGDKTIWGYFYANPEDVNWGGTENPEVFVKALISADGQVEVSYMHASVPHIDVYTTYRNMAGEVLNLSDETSTYARYVSHTFYPDGSSNTETRNTSWVYPWREPTVPPEDVGTLSPKHYPNLLTQVPTGVPIRHNLNIASLMYTDNTYLVDGIWRLGGQDETPRGDQVIWGYFYANPTQIDGGNENIPEVFVKVWFNRNGTLDINYLHVSTQDIYVYTDYTWPSGAIRAGADLLQPNSPYTRH